MDIGVSGPNFHKVWLSSHKYSVDLSAGVAVLLMPPTTMEHITVEVPFCFFNLTKKLLTQKMLATSYSRLISYLFQELSSFISQKILEETCEYKCVFSSLCY